MLKRHSRAAIFLHWFNAICFIFLLLSGLAILGKHLQPVGDWWHGFWHGVFGPAGLVYVHIGVGCVWIAGYSLALIFFGKSVCWPFLKRVCVFRPATDMQWCVKKGLSLTVGSKICSSMGIDTTLPPQGFYNAGQRLVAVLAVICGAGLAVTGLILAFFSGSAWQAASEYVLQWAILLHFCFAGVMLIFLPIHIYMASLAPGEGPALKSMFTGHVPKSYAAHHNPLWHMEECGEPQIRDESLGGAAGREAEMAQK